MPGTLYRIKLYGHSGSDTELFCRNLAALMDIDAERARTLLSDAPAIIKEGIEKQKAEEFCKQLEPIRALCMIEPMDGEVIEKPPSEAIASTLLPESPEADDLKKKAARRSWIWTAALAATIGVLLIFVGSGVISSLWRAYHHNRPPATAPRGSAGPIDSQVEPLPADAGPVSFEELQAQVDELEARIESNRFRLAQAEQARDGLHRSPRTPNRDLEANALIIRDLKDEIQRDAAELKILKRRLEKME